MAAAFGWGTLAAFSLVIGAVLALRFCIGLRAIGLITGFGAGVLISAMPPATSKAAPRWPSCSAPSSTASPSRWSSA